MKKRIRIQGILIFLTVIITILLPKFIFPQWKQEPLDEFLDAFGTGLVLFGFLFRITARGYKEQESTGGKKLVKYGPYQLMRNPMYFGTLLIGTGVIFVLFKFWSIPLFFVTYLLIYIPQMKKEETVLLKRFGEEYKDYCKITPKYFPKIYSLLNLKEYIILKLSWVKKELLSFILVIIAVLAIETYEDVKLFGYKEFPKELLELVSIILSFIVIIILFIKKDERNK